MRWMIWGGQSSSSPAAQDVRRLTVCGPPSGAIAGLFIALCIGAAFIAVVSLSGPAKTRETRLRIQSGLVSTVLHDSERSLVQVGRDLGGRLLARRLYHHHDDGPHHVSRVAFPLGHFSIPKLGPHLFTSRPPPPPLPRVVRLRIDRSKIKWRAKLAGAFDNKVELKSKKDQREAKSSKWTLFLLPMITVLREGLEAVVFVGGVSLGQSAKSIPLAAICGVLVGFIVGCESRPYLTTLTSYVIDRYSWITRADTCTRSSTCYRLDLRFGFARQLVHLPGHLDSSSPLARSRFVLQGRGRLRDLQVQQRVRGDP